MDSSREAGFQQGIIAEMAGGARPKRGVQFCHCHSQAPELVFLYRSELELTHYRMTKREEKRFALEVTEGDPLKPVSDVGSGKLFDPEKQRLEEIIERLNDL